MEAEAVMNQAVVLVVTKVMLMVGAATVAAAMGCRTSGLGSARRSRSPCMSRRKRHQQCHT